MILTSSYGVTTAHTIIWEGFYITGGLFYFKVSFLSVYLTFLLLFCYLQPWPRVQEVGEATGDSKEPDSGLQTSHDLILNLVLSIFPLYNQKEHCYYRLVPIL